MKYIVAIDQSTSASKAFLVDGAGAIAGKAARAHKQYYPRDGYAEHDAEEIYQNVLAILDEVTRGVQDDDIAALAIANQRETVVLWDRETGAPVCPAIVWQDVRGIEVCRELAGEADYILKTTGMAVSPYYPAAKVSQLFRERPDIRERAFAGDIAMGTIESYLIYRLTGRHVGDFSNASRTQLMDLRTLKWDKKLADMFGLPMGMLPEKLLPTDGDFGVWRGAPITGVLGDSHATLFGQGCVTSGSVKVSYGTGSSVMMNIGDTPRISKGDLTTAVAFNYGGKTHYQTEGNITTSCDTLVWLCREMGLFRDEAEIEKLANSVKDCGGVSLVPALSGLGAPFFDPEARAVICGLSRGSTRAHVARAALTGIAQRCADVTEAMAAFTGKKPVYMMADGGGARNDLLMQIQSDLADCQVRRSAFTELSALGAAYMAGIATNFYKGLDKIPARTEAQKIFKPDMTDKDRDEARSKWAKAIARARLK